MMVFDLFLLTHLWVFWIGLLIAFLVTEGLSQNFITIWLAVGSLAGLFAERLLLSFTVQVVVFAIISILCIIFLRPFCMRILHSRTQATNIAALIGKQVMTQSDIDSFQTGQVKLGGQIWTAIAVEGAAIPKNSRATVKEIRGVKLILAPQQTEPHQSEELQKNKSFF